MKPNNIYTKSSIIFIYFKILGNSFRDYFVINHAFMYTIVWLILIHKTNLDMLHSTEKDKQFLQFFEILNVVTWNIIFIILKFLYYLIRKVYFRFRNSTIILTLKKNKMKQVWFDWKVQFSPVFGILDVIAWNLIYIFNLFFLIFSKR